MVYESIDHGNDVICHVVSVVLFLIFRKKKSVIVKNKSTTIIHGLYECRPWKIVVDFLIVGYFNAWAYSLGGCYVAKCYEVARVDLPCWNENSANRE